MAFNPTFQGQLNTMGSQGENYLSDFMAGKLPGGYNINQLNNNEAAKVLGLVGQTMGDAGVDAQSLFTNYVDPVLAQKNLNPTLANAVMDVYVNAINSGIVSPNSLPQGLVDLMNANMNGGSRQKAMVSQALTSLAGNDNLNNNDQFLNIFNNFRKNVGTNLSDMSPGMWGVAASPYFQMLESNAPKAGTISFPGSMSGYSPANRADLQSMASGYEAVTNGGSLPNILSSWLKGTLNSLTNRGQNITALTRSTTTAPKPKGAKATLSGSGQLSAAKQVEFDGLVAMLNSPQMRGKQKAYLNDPTNNAALVSKYGVGKVHELYSMF